LASASHNARTIIGKLGIADAFDFIADPGNSGRPKPAPDIFLTAAAALHADPARCIGVEDAIAGVTAIKQAGMKAIGVGDSRALADADVVVTPVHPYIKVFDLGRHHFVLTHVRNLTLYVYDETAASKLVLDERTKSLITILVEGSSEVMEDIVKGKTGGTIVIATGPPGTGKTLTAEVFAEEIQKPLYVVQCSQLGTDEEKVENQLQKVLARASRWSAILLIDEADVYVHARGSDIQQNAIVGVFLRVLEHYRGVLFLTSNRSTVIDDAIMSRATAWIRYEYPTREQLAAIWDVLSKQYEMPMNGGTIRGLVNDFPKISGRNVKNLLKLGRMLHKRDPKKNKIDAELFQYVSNFLDLKAETEGT